MGIVFLVLFWCLVHEPAALEKLLFSFGWQPYWLSVCMSESTVGSQTSDGPQHVIHSHGTKLWGVPLREPGIPQPMMTWVVQPEALIRWCLISINQLLQHLREVGKHLSSLFRQGTKAWRGLTDRVTELAGFLTYCLMITGEWVQNKFILYIIQGICLLVREHFWQLWLPKRLKVLSLAVQWLGANAWGTWLNDCHEWCEKMRKKKQNMVM